MEFLGNLILFVISIALIVVCWWFVGFGFGVVADLVQHGWSVGRGIF